MQKQSFYFFLLFLIGLLGFNSCTIKKRLYQPGYHVEWHNINKETKPNQRNEALTSNDLDSKEEIVFENQENIIEDSNQTEIIQEFEPFYAFNDESNNNIEIINSNNQKFTSTSNANKVTSDINNSEIGENTVKPNDKSNDTKKLHWTSKVGLVLSIIGLAAIISLICINLPWYFVRLFIYFSVISSIAGTILSVIALVIISKSPEIYNGIGFTIAGLIVPLFTAFFWALVMTVFAKT